MDGSTFDKLTRMVGGAGTRRGALRSALGGAAVSVLALAGFGAAVGEAEAKKRKKKCKKPQEGCRKSSQCCGRKKNFTCGFSHGGGTATRTCCGEVGASCPGNALGCCIPLLCVNNQCAAP